MKTVGELKAILDEFPNEMEVKFTPVDDPSLMAVTAYNTFVLTEDDKFELTNEDDDRFSDATVAFFLKISE